MAWRSKRKKFVKLEFGAKGYLNDPTFRGTACTIGGSAIGASIGYIIEEASGAFKGAVIGGGISFFLWLLAEMTLGKRKRGVDYAQDF
jgi:hypothetical protein